MARLLAGRQLIIERSDIDLLLAHLHGWVPKGRNKTFSDLTFLNNLQKKREIPEETFEEFVRAYTLGSTFSHQFHVWRRVFNDILRSDECHRKLDTARSAENERKMNATVDLIAWIADQTKEHNGKHQYSAASKFAMFLWPDLPVFINDSVVRSRAGFIDPDTGNDNIKRDQYDVLSARCQFLYNPVIQEPFITNVALPDLKTRVHPDWLSRRLLDLALYRAVIADDPIPRPDAPRIVFCPCALPRQQRAAAA